MKEKFTVDFGSGYTIKLEKENPMIMKIFCERNKKWYYIYISRNKESGLYMSGEKKD